MPAPAPVPPDATLRSVLPLLEDPLDFVRQAFGVINHYHKLHGSAVLRLGVSQGSKGKRPNYLIENSSTKALLATIDGNNHKKWPNDEVDTGGGWSSLVMTFEEVKQLLKALRANEQRR